MNDCTSLQTQLRAELSVATNEVNEWRGRCVNLFAMGELAVSVALKKRQPTRKLPMMVGQRVQRLIDDPSSDAARDCLTEFSGLLVDRTALTHGSGKPWVREGGKWLLTLEWITAKGLERRTFSSSETTEFHDRLRAAVQRIKIALRN